MRILQSGNNKIYMKHRCSLNKLAFAALHLTSCSSSVLAGNSLGCGGVLLSPKCLKGGLKVPACRYVLVVTWPH